MPPSASPSSTSAVLLALVDSGLEPLGPGPLALGAGLGVELLSAYAARSRRGDALNEPPGTGATHLRAAVAVAGAAPHLFPGLTRETAELVAVAPDGGLQACGGAAVDAVLGGAFAANLRDLSCGRAVAVLTPCTGSGSPAAQALYTIEVRALCPWVAGSAPIAIHGESDAAAAPLALLPPHTLADAALSRATAGLLHPCTAVGVSEVPPDAVTTTSWSGWLPHAVVEGLRGAEDGCGGRALAGFLSRLPERFGDAAARAALLASSVVEVEWQTQGRGGSGSGSSAAAADEWPLVAVRAPPKRLLTATAPAGGAPPSSGAPAWGALVSALSGAPVHTQRAAAAALLAQCAAPGPGRTVLVDQLAAWLLPHLLQQLPPPRLPDVEALIVALRGQVVSLQ